MARRPIIAGNWKMNNTIAAGVKLINELKPLVADNKEVDVVACAPATCLSAIAEAGRQLRVAISTSCVWLTGVSLGFPI